MKKHIQEFPTAKGQKPSICQKAQTEHGHPSSLPWGKAKGIVHMPKSRNETSRSRKLSKKACGFRQTPEMLQDVPGFSSGKKLEGSEKNLTMCERKRMGTVDTMYLCLVQYSRNRIWVLMCQSFGLLLDMPQKTTKRKGPVAKVAFRIGSIDSPVLSKPFLSSLTSKMCCFVWCKRWKCLKQIEAQKWGQTKNPLQNLCF